MIRSSVAGLAFSAVLLTSACTSQDQPSAPMADNVAVSNQWAGAAERGAMTAVFGSVGNDGPGEARVVGGSSPQAARVEVHEVVPDAAGTMTMQPKDGGLTVPAGQTRELIPGGDHLMLMDLTQPLLPGADVEVILEFADGSTLPFTAQVRDFAGGHEDYRPDAGAEGAPHHHG
ncbi:hypothetical protein CRI77_01700 [Mycolicibacterium duvalii]|nr:copper chaperone PCu(A)C [Mycolicibacterium duvalii]MCV7367561.1 copper chaperone PCu(A)C [Mycolicibacterium duvalii]PEG44266.1 hypothetical protein CRI77_01700 [Mycolicibacterium duvalii]